MSINRSTLPTNFLDSVNDMGLTLPQPEPQYLFAKWAMAGRLSLAALNAGAPTVQQFVSMAGGGKPISPALDEMARAADMYPGFVNAIESFGLGKGDTIKFQRMVYNAATDGYTAGSRELATDSTISTTGQTVQAEEVPVVLKEYVGPINGAGTAVAPYAIWDFDAKYRANKLQLASVTSRHLQRDYVKVLDRSIRDLLTASSNITYADDVADVAEMTAGAGHILSLETILKARKELSDREWTKFPNGRYVLLVPTVFNTDMVQDADYRELARAHADGRNQLFGYITSVQDIDIFECTTLQSVAAAGTYAGATVPSSVTVHESLLLGPGAIGFGTALAPECRWADDTNYGTVAKCIWYALHAFSTLDTRGVQKIASQEG
jgi:hypothetical protein